MGTNYTFTSIVDLNNWLQQEYRALAGLGIDWLEPPKIQGSSGKTMLVQRITPSTKKASQAPVPELIPQWKDVYGWQATHPGNWWLQKNKDFNDPVTVRSR